MDEFFEDENKKNNETVEETEVQQDTQPENTENVEKQVCEEDIKQQMIDEIVAKLAQQQPKEYKKPSKVPLILYLVFTLLLCCGCSYATAKYVSKRSPTKVVYEQLPTVVTNTTENVSYTTLDISAMVENVENSIVEIYTEAVTYSSFYGQYVQEGAGSGVVFTSDGYIVTNNHVIDGATSIKVKTKDGKEFDGQLIAADAKSDLAVVKIDATDLNPVVLADSTDLKAGQQCVAIGNPLGTLGGSVTTGIISAPAREITIDGTTMTLLQIDASINPGNSGGGLFNTQGQLIGIVNAKSTGNDVEGIGFAIPVSEVKTIVSQLIENGYVIGRAQIGIKCTSIESIQTAWQYGVNSYGVYVNEVVGENAKNAGIEEGDVIVGIDDTKISSYEDMKAALNNYTAGDEVTISIVRGRESVTITMVLEQKTN